MSFNLNVNITPRDLRGLLPKERKAILKKRRIALLSTAEKGIEIIQNLRERGYGYKGAFPSYSKGYAQFLRKKGHGLTPDLDFSGQMIENVTSKANSSRAIIYFTSETESKKAAFNNKLRPFMGFSRKDSQELSAFFARRLA